MDELTGLFYLAFVAGVAWYAHSRGRSPWAWGLVALIFSPLIAFLILAFMKDQQVKQRLDHLDHQTQNLGREMHYHKEFNDYRAQQLQQQIQTTQQQQLAFQQANRMQSRALPMGHQNQSCEHCHFHFSSDQKICPNCGQFAQNQLQVFQFQFAMICPLSTHISYAQDLLMKSDQQQQIKEIEYLDIQTGGSLGGQQKKLIFVISGWRSLQQDPDHLEAQIRKILVHAVEKAGYQAAT